MGLPPGARFEFSPAVKIIQRLRAVADDRDLVGQMVLLQRGQRQFHILRIVFDQQDVFDVYYFSVHRCLRFVFGMEK